MPTVRRSFLTSEMTNSARPALESALISAPTSVLRVVTMPSNGAVSFLKSESTISRSRLACAALVRAAFTVRSPVFSSTV